jgi:hypothetical protein
VTIHYKDATKTITVRLKNYSDHYSASNRIAEQKEKSNQTKACPIKRKIQEAINCSVYFYKSILPFDKYRLLEPT